MFDMTLDRLIAHAALSDYTLTDRNDSFSLSKSGREYVVRTRIDGAGRRQFESAQREGHGEVWVVPIHLRDDMGLSYRYGKPLPAWLALVDEVVS